MIVKNEEKNIERALNWAKPVAYEQIVVDTGSTDRTVELAEKAGAKVFHFEWIKDFSAAKNYAIEQATGNWIAFLDADEYLSPEDAEKLIKKLESIKNERDMSKSTTILTMPWVQLEDNGEASSIDQQSRIFRNIKEIRYVGRIHEQVSVYGNIMYVDNISIMHTGYALTEHKEKKKSERNVELLREELKHKPNDLITKAYLADSLQSKTILDEYKNEEEVAEVDELFMEVITSDAPMLGFLKKKAFIYHIGKVWNDPEKQKECDELCEKAYKKFPDDLELGYYHALMLNNKGEYAKAWRILKKLEPALTSDTDFKLGNTMLVLTEPKMIFGQLLIAAQGLEDVENTITYATILLTSDKTQNNILTPYIHTLLKHNTSEDEILGLLANIYDITSPGDLLLIARAAKDCGAIEFAKLIMMLAEEQMR